MQFQVPQFIETEDKIVGPLSIRQFVYIVAAAGVSTMLYFSVPAWLWLTLSVPILGIGGALAFAKINGRPFAKFLFATLSFYWKPQTYVWQPEQPHLPKTPTAVMESSAPGAFAGFSLEKLFAGMSLKKTWNRVQTGSAPEPEARPKPSNERYEIFQKITGEQNAAKRVDYR